LIIGTNGKISTAKRKAGEGKEKERRIKLGEKGVLFFLTERQVEK